MDLEALIAGKRVYLDTNIVIYLIEGHAPYRAALQLIDEAVAEGKVRLLTGEITLIEVLSGPLAANRMDIVARYRTFLENDAVIELIPTVRDVYLNAAVYRAAHGLETPDAIHVASAIAGNCDVFLTNDSRLRVPSALTRVLLGRVM
jgi:predicted nucleic acid-binding protein